MKLENKGSGRKAGNVSYLRWRIAKARMSEHPVAGRDLETSFLAVEEIAPRYRS